MRQLLSTAFWTLITLCAFPLTSSAIEMTGRVSGDLYTYEGQSENHMRPYLRFRGNAFMWQAAGGRFVRLHTSMRWAGDFIDPLPSDPELFVYDAYVHVQNLIPRTGLYAGRQFVFTGVGSALMDGGRVVVRPFKFIDFEAFGGSAVSSEDPERVRSFNDYLVTGARLAGYPHRSARVALNWMLMRRDRRASYHRAGIDADYVIGPAEVYGRGSFNAVNYSLAEVHARAIYRPPKWYLSGEYHLREPSVAYNSIFALIDYYRYEIIRIEGRRRVWRQISLAAHIDADVGSQNDTPWRVSVGVQAPAYSLLWIHQTGYAGDNDGVSGYFTRAFTNEWSAYVTANLFRYRVQLEQMERSDSYASTVGVRWQPGHGISVLAEYQYLRNAVYKNDGRFLIRLAKDFSVKSKPKEAR